MAAQPTAVQPALEWLSQATVLLERMASTPWYPSASTTSTSSSWVTFTINDGSS